MGPVPTQMRNKALPDKQTLNKYITDLFRKAGKLDSQNVPHIKTAPPGNYTGLDCVKHFFEKHPDDLAKEAYCFMPDNHNVADLNRPSFARFQRLWERKSGKSGKGNDRFPEVRKRNAIDPFSRCTLRCMCDSCNQDNAEGLICDRYAFGDDHMILIHKFHWEGQTWAAVLGTRDDPEEYSIWGKIDEDTRQTSYHDRILLKEIARAKPPKRSGRHDVSAGDDGEFAPDTEHPKKRANTPTALRPTKRRRPTAKSAGHPESTPKNIERSRNAAMHTPISDDEEDLKLSELRACKRKALADPLHDNISTANPDPARAPRLQQATPDMEQTHDCDLQESFLDTQAYVYSRVGRDGKPVISSNAALVTFMQGLEDAASKNNAYLFRSMRVTIGRELAKLGLPDLPDV